MDAVGAQPESVHPAPHAVGPGSAIVAALGDIKLAHTVFALPFAVLAAFLVAPRQLDGSIIWSTFAGQLALVVVCMVFARSWAMLVNRLADHRFDAENPRTARRAIPAGRLGVRQGWALAVGAAVMFCAGASMFWVLFGNPWPAILAVPVLAWIALYSFTKRFTVLCHLFLGGALGASPIAAAIAVNPDLILTLGASPVRGTILLIAAFVVLWVAGFDVAYALADIEVDRRMGLRSIPARVGVRGALWVSRGLHIAAFVALILIAQRPDLGSVFFGATLGVGCLLIFEHLVLARRGIAGLPVAFFTVNGVISVTLAIAGIIDLLKG